ncbi:protein FAR-RED IMPAIRED RESPONSE 1-like [Triticum urartu]|uniref:Protein FAR1-RELATED SEQUENCE n=1 Tax=Triticum urartu TaxID=4572 RepID=A0A8R7QCX8_TRIUA|nr:protein FAR-RED IMPAIRED RESPONSE 1-like [Triticum urartu]XP_048551758.1 protein FAR-RED IMPAIRED RESPONSE 1-like [Triticum urartu]
MPFGLFVGVNNHFQSIILGGVLLRDETTETFEWVFKEFASLTGGKAPKTILTDQARAMERAICSQWPDTTHRWCKWHVLQKAREHLGSVYSKNSDFRDEFHKLLEYMVTVDEFETAWAGLIEKYQLAEHPWLTQIYEVRAKWAKPYFAGVFCARMTSTQRSESANHMLKNYVQPASSMNNFVRQYQKLLFDRQSEEDFQAKKTRVGGVAFNPGVPLEYHASKVYTAAMYELFQHAIYLSGSFVLQEAWQTEQGMVYVVDHIYAERRQSWSRTQYHVLFHQGSGGYLCECGLYSHMGMLCCHAIRVLLHLGVREIPEVHIMKRWTKNAWENLPEQLMIYKACNSALKDATYRHSSLYSKALEIVQMGDKNTEAYGAAMKQLLDAISVLNDINQESDGRGLNDQATAQAHDQDVPVTPGANGLSGSMNVVSRKRDRGRPTNARAKPGYENVSKPRTKFCSICRGRGHKASGCPSYGGVAKKQRKVPKCTKCGLKGHKRNNCSGRMFGVFQ